MREIYMAAANHSVHHAEAETLRRHREMFERRLRELSRNGGLTSRQIVDSANDPARYRRREGIEQNTEEEEEAAANH